MSEPTPSAAEKLTHKDVETLVAVATRLEYNKATDLAERVREIATKIERESHHSGQAVDRQEEAAYEKLQIKCQGCGVSWFIEIPSETWWSGALAEASELMNRELTAERQRAESERDGKNLYMGREKVLRSQLLSAQAAIEKFNSGLVALNPSNGIKVDLLLLHQHDAEVRRLGFQEGWEQGRKQGIELAESSAAEVRKPLVEALRRIENANYGNDLGAVRAIARRALAKVKEKL